MQLIETDDRPDPTGMMPTYPAPPVCPHCHAPLVMQGFLYWCQWCEQGYKDMDWNDYKENQ